MRLDKRLQALEARAKEVGECPACRHRRGVFVFLERYDPEGGDPMPPPCERCGKVAEFIIEYRLTPPRTDLDGEDGMLPPE
jgi:hypothetical protein